jgi:hypothetical protein
MWFVSFTPLLSYSWYPINRRLGRSKGWCGHNGKQKTLSLVQYPACPTILSWFKIDHRISKYEVISNAICIKKYRKAEMVFISERIQKTNLKPGTRNEL